MKTVFLLLWLSNGPSSDVLTAVEFPTMAQCQDVGNKLKKTGWGGYFLCVERTM